MMLRQTHFLKKLIQKEEIGGLFLMGAMICALIWANSPWRENYEGWKNLWIGFSLGDLSTGMSMKSFIDEVLMTFFFVLVGCELKREKLEGELSTKQQIRLPLFAAAGGMIIPAMLFIGVNLALGDPAGSQSHYMRGWAIPTATDIAFALGIFALVGQHLPRSLKTFLLALAVIDDLGAVLLIGLFYTDTFQFYAFLGAVVVSGGLWYLNKKDVQTFYPYVILGVFLWIFVHKSGIHSTLAGVLFALFLPLRSEGKVARRRSLLKSLEHALQPFVLFMIMPLFALVNAGVSLDGMSLDTLASPLTLGIIAGLFVGKQIGVLVGAYVGVKLGLVQLPQDTRWSHIYGVGLLCGIGFTMSLFIGILAFSDAQSLTDMRVGILTASILSAVAGCIALSWQRGGEALSDTSRLVPLAGQK